MERGFWRKYEDVGKLVLAAVKLGSRGGRLCCRTRMRVALFLLAWEFEELAHLRGEFYMWLADVDVAVKVLVEKGFLEERLEVPGAVDGVRLPRRIIYTYRLTKAGRVLADDAVKEISPKVRRRMKELLKLDVWALVGYAYVKYPEQFATKEFALA